VSSPGAYIILQRDAVRELLAREDDASRRQFIERLRKSPKYLEADLVFECGTAWDPIHRCLTEGTLDAEGGEFPLNHCVLGGRRLHEGDDFEAVYLRPDIVPFVAEAIGDVKRAELYEIYMRLDPADYGRPSSEKEFDEIWSIFKQIRQFLDSAAMERDAVLFTVER
jgi:hypothetical protein